MRLGTVSPGKDGRLILIHEDAGLARYAECVPTLREALENWKNYGPKLELEYSNFLRKEPSPNTIALDQVELLAPLPRAWAFFDGSAYLEHVKLARHARGAELPPKLFDVPLMYQGINDCFLPPQHTLPPTFNEYDLDYEYEIGVITTDVPQGIDKQEAHHYIALITLINDFTLRSLVRGEVETGFGFIQSKPPSALGPYAVTPGELGEFWKDSRLHATLHVQRNFQDVGKLDTSEMHFSFADLIAHAARTRALSAGTIIGSGTVSNTQNTAGSACIVEQRMRETLQGGSAHTSFLQSGDSVTGEVFLPDGSSPFGRNSVQIVSPEK
ncbi:MAG: fumarylacetoacetate hydrolase family protein [Bdellovibrionales bacterium]|nr:fumarylacetoacetate hydrolase family protein [Bdellovibrionales bacterium]